MRQALDAEDRARREEEVGDLLFVGVNLARFLGLDAEIALKRANRKFSERFREMERMAAARGKQLSALSADELETLWNEAKALEAPTCRSLAGAQSALIGSQSSPSPATIPA